MSDENELDESIKNSHYPVWLKKLTLPKALGLVILTSVLFVSIGYLMYWGSKDRKYDIARPDKENTSQGIDVTDLEENISTPVDLAAVRDKIKFLEREQAALRGMNKLDVINLSDQNILLVPSDQPSL